jgi:hypothetical protein
MLIDYCCGVRAARFLKLIDARGGVVIVSDYAG